MQVTQITHQKSEYLPVEQFGLSIVKEELIDCYESAKLPLYIPKGKRKVGTHGVPDLGYPGAELGIQS